MAVASLLAALLTGAQSAPRERPLIWWMPGPVRCADGASPVARPMRRPLGRMVWPVDDPVRPITYRFGIDEGGRTIDIEAEVEHDPLLKDDIAPSLAASRFDAGTPRTGCRITYMPRQSRVAETPPGDLASFALTPIGGVLPRDGWERIQSSAGCPDRPRPLNQAYPDLDEVSATPGVRDWTFLTYDIGRSGRTSKVRVLQSSGNAALDAASIRALRQSRYANGAQTGCAFHFWRGAGKLPAPSAPEEAAFRAPTATCPTDGRQWARPPELRFPGNYNRRRIEGWAMVSYDTLASGVPDNVRALAAQPSADFGRQAINIVRSGRMGPLAAGKTGCIDRIVFLVRDEGGSSPVP